MIVTDDHLNDINITDSPDKARRFSFLICIPSLFILKFQIVMRGILNLGRE